jgi:hypothetical protein
MESQKRLRKNDILLSQIRALFALAPGSGITKERLEKVLLDKHEQPEADEPPNDPAHGEENPGEDSHGEVHKEHDAGEKHHDSHGGEAHDTHSKEVHGHKEHGHEDHGVHGGGHGHGEHEIERLTTEEFNFRVSRAIFRFILLMAIFVVGIYITFIFNAGIIGILLTLGAGLEIPKLIWKEPKAHH